MQDLDGAVLDGTLATELLEWAATVYRRAVQIGTPRVLAQAALNAVVEAVVARGYGRPRRITEDERGR